jgi:hypothetical protein
MAHFAELDSNGVVVQVIVIANEDCGGGEFPESEAAGQAFINTLPPHAGKTWKQTSYNNNFRARYAGVGYSYNEVFDAFVAPQPFPSWTLNEETTEWEAPVPRPEEGMWAWNEEEQQWDAVDMGA